MPQASIGHLLNLLDEVVLNQQMNYVDKVRYITPISDAIAKLIQADKASSQAGLSPDQQMQIENQKMAMEQQKNDREHGLKLYELQQKMELEKAQKSHDAAMEMQQAAVDQVHAQQQHQAQLDQMQHQKEMAIRDQDHAEMMDQRKQQMAEKLAKGKAEPSAGQSVV